MNRYARIFSILFLGVLPFFAVGQEVSITGSVKDSDGLPLIAAQITLVSNGEEFFTDFKGSFHLKVERGETLRFSYAGYQSQEIKILDQEKIEVVMGEEVKLNEKSISAYGLQPYHRSISYSTDKIDSGLLQQLPGILLTERLEGNTHGLHSLPDEGGPGHSSYLSFRGSLPTGYRTGRQPLIIVDGIPLDNSLYLSGDGQNRTLSNRIDDLLPEDIQSITLLKSGAGSALYGIHAPDGALFITTKKGSDSLNVEFSSSFGIENILSTPDYQNKFTQGYMGIYDTESSWPGWGPTISEAQKINPNHPDQLFNNFLNAYRQGNSWQNTLAVSGGGSESGFRISLGHHDQQGILPNSDFKNLSGHLSGFIRPAEKLKLTGGFLFNHSGGERANAIRFNQELIAWSPSVDVNDHRFPDNTMKGDYNNGHQGQNPIYGTETNFFRDQVNHYFGHLSAEYEVSDWISLIYRAGIDTYTDFRKSGAEGPQNIENENIYLANGSGFAGETHIKNHLWNSHLILQFDKDLADRFRTGFLVGTEINKKIYDRRSTSGSQLSQWDQPDLQYVDPNSITTTSINIPHTSFGFFGQGNLQYDQTISLTLSHRLDKNRIIPDHATFHSSSAGLNYIFTEHFQPLMGLLDMGKIRASYSTVQRDPFPFTPETSYLPGDFGGFHTDEIKVSEHISPERIRTFETGVDLGAMGGKIGMSFSYFHILNKDMILPVNILDEFSPYDIIDNAASIRQTGTEWSLDLHPLQSKIFQWDIGLHFSTQKNRILSIAEGKNNILLAHDDNLGGSSASLRLVEGQSLGDIYGSSYQRYQPQNHKKVDQSAPLLIGEDGFPIKNEEDLILGNIFPDWTGSLSTRLRFGNIELFGLIDTWQGIQRYDAMENIMVWNGVASYTEDRDQMVVFEGMKSNGESNNQSVYKGQGTGPDGVDYGKGFYQNVYNEVTENFIHQSDWIRLRSLRISYEFPKKWIKKTPLSNIKASAAGYNLWIQSDNPDFHPGSHWSSVGRNDSYTSFQYPSSKRFIFSLKFQF